jgi:acetyltransferase-like isoleucine patch superfamily enzyme
MDNMVIGENTCIGDDSWFNVNRRDTSEKYLIIGKNCSIGRRNFFTVGKEIIIGDYFLSSIDCSFICSTHLYEENLPHLLGALDIKNSIIVGCNVFVGAHSCIVGNVSIGYGSIIGAKTTVLKDIPPLSTVVGPEGKIIKRFNVEKGRWDSPENVDTRFYLTEEEYRDKLLKNYLHFPKATYAASSREGWL